MLTHKIGSGEAAFQVDLAQLRHRLIKRRSPFRLAHSRLKSKFWIGGPPAVDRVRPERCPECYAPGHPAGGRVGLHGHGVRRRQLRGPPRPSGEPELRELVIRRYRCRHCEAVITVVPPEVAPKRLFSRSAIGLALALFGRLRQSPRQVREQISPWRCLGAAAARGWVTLPRWARAVAQGRLLPAVRSCPGEWSLRRVAERAASTLMALAPPELSTATIEEQVFAGAERALEVMASAA